MSQPLITPSYPIEFVINRKVFFMMSYDVRMFAFLQGLHEGYPDIPLDLTEDFVTATGASSDEGEEFFVWFLEFLTMRFVDKVEEERGLALWRSLTLERYRVFAYFIDFLSPVGRGESFEGVYLLMNDGYCRFVNGLTFLASTEDRESLDRVNAQVGEYGNDFRLYDETLKETIREMEKRIYYIAKDLRDYMERVNPEDGDINPLYESILPDIYLMFQVSDIIDRTRGKGSTPKVSSMIGEFDDYLSSFTLYPERIIIKGVARYLT
jgi:hypothetical protein